MHPYRTILFNESRLLLCLLLHVYMIMHIIHKLCLFIFDIPPSAVSIPPADVHSVTVGYKVFGYLH